MVQGYEAVFGGEHVDVLCVVLYVGQGLPEKRRN